MIFNELKKREIPFNVVQSYQSMGRILNTETRVYSIVVLNQFALKLEGLMSGEGNDGFYYSEYENVYCYEMNKDEIKQFSALRLPVAFQTQCDGTFFGEDLRKYKTKKTI
jgi:hypothetical protein